MILNLNKTEMAVLLLHFSLMRKSARNTFKRNYGKQSKEMLSSFDEIKDNLELAIEEEKEKETFHFNIKEINMLHSFLESYIGKLESTLQATGKVEYEDQKQIDCLRDIQERTQKLIGVA